MYTIYLVFYIVLAISFITGIIITIFEHKHKKTDKINIDKELLR